MEDILAFKKRCEEALTEELEKLEKNMADVDEYVYQCEPTKEELTSYYKRLGILRTELNRRMQVHSPFACLKQQ